MKKHVKTASHESGIVLVRSASLTGRREVARTFVGPIDIEEVPSCEGEVARTDGDVAGEDVGDEDRREEVGSRANVGERVEVRVDSELILLSRAVGDEVSVGVPND